MQKRALVTGASSGIGRVFADRLAADGFAVTAVARSTEKLHTLVESLSGKPHDFLTADLSTDGGMAHVEERLKETPYDLLVNNAGVGYYGDFSEAVLDEQLALMRLNVDALVRLSHTYLQTARPGDALINVSSMLAFLPLPNSSIYCGTKAFVTMFSETLWHEQKKRGVYVMSLNPGTTATAFQKNAGGPINHDPPAAITQSSEGVVEAALHALRVRTEPVVFTSRRNLFFEIFSRLLPRRAVIALMGSVR